MMVQASKSLGGMLFEETCFGLVLQQDYSHLYHSLSCPQFPLLTTKLFQLVSCLWYAYQNFDFPFIMTLFCREDVILRGTQPIKTDHLTSFPTSMLSG